TVICEYLEDRYPQPSLLPADVVERAKARWLEEYADTRIGEVIIWRLFNQKVINPFIWGEPTDEAVLAKTLDEEIPQVLGYLESQLPADGFLFGDLSIADISIATFFRNAAFARFRIDAARWPKAAAFVDRVLSTDSFQKLKPFEEKMVRTPPPQHREALAALGAPLMSETFGTSSAQRGMMRI
ncbi:MAG TPA: glutathione S-transferase family protein, partial [Candidatus Acidoferrales bacterium]|nr:glutathione S-transferase family protein [Candidatus Acidoferrales bacterium]